MMLEVKSLALLAGSLSGCLASVDPICARNLAILLSHLHCIRAALVP